MEDLRANARSVLGRIDEKIALSDKWRKNPGLWDNIVWRPCTVRILLVCDGFLYFSDEDFGLSDLVTILKDEPFPFAHFDLTAAHRSDVSAARSGAGNARISKVIENFRFDNPAKFDPAGYDEVWIFSSDRSSKGQGNNWSPRISDGELKVLSQFMDEGGGVFATGDHEDLGCAVGGFVPRVRSMRRWFHPVPGPNGEGTAPPFDTSGRFDTNREGPTGGFQFNDQSDVVPQVIEPHYYTASAGIFRETSWPHPLLCGPSGVVTTLPDHAHESQCTTAAETNRSWNYGGYAITEFPPALNGGTRPLPEIVAWSRVLGGHTTSGKSGNTVARRFGAIAAYDGHRAGVGRVTTDATWHHFLNINLTGEAGAAFPKNIGFLASPEGLASYEEIKAYFRNIALWIARPEKLKCMRNWSLLLVIHSHRFKEIYDPSVTIANAGTSDFIFVGRHARDAIGLYASRCQSTRWILDLVLERMPKEHWFDPIDPWRPQADLDHDGPADQDRKGDGEEATLPPFVDLEWVAEAALGGAVLALREKLFPLKAAQVDRLSGDELDFLVDEGANAGLRKAAQNLDEANKRLDTFVAHFSRSLR